ncbi:sensor domain-containing diguanylate cyclase [Bacillus sonorensis]|uniref:sensor domain-containing diguanylate cyclase n=1 Tax=Bacillus sonorensis TaxID=119858 RepID=UPI00098B612F|nr:diguanylate cyclase [Bacillus sonorensis]
MNRQTEDLYLSFHQEILQFLLKKPALSYNNSVVWLKEAAESFFSPISLTLQASSHKPAKLKDHNDSISCINDYYTIITIERNSKYIELISLKNRKIPKNLAESIYMFLKHCTELEKTHRDTLRKTRIYKETERVHGLMDQEKVLKTMLESLRGIFPDLTYCLFLSFDQDQYINLPAKEIDVQNETTDPFALEAYLSGKRKQKDDSIVYIPIKGRQGTYGVLKASGPDAAGMAEEICVISNAAGTAFENSRLYEQSKNMISNLELINETSHQLNRTKQLPDMMKNLSDRLIGSFGAEEVGFFYHNHLEEENLLPGSTSFFETDAADPYIRYVKEKVSEENGVFVGNGSTLFGQDGYASLMGVPMLENNENKGFVIVLKKNACSFTFEMFKLFQTLIRHSTLAVSNSMLRDRLKYLVQTDRLTELYSRSFLDEKIQHSMKADQSGVFLLIDIDDFKQINDTYGHQKGDEILIQVSRAIQRNIREQDVGARWGGEELAIYLPKADLHAGKMLAGRLIALVRECTNPQVTISCGISCWSMNCPKTLASLVKQADIALYDAKRNGKNKLSVYNASS